MKNLLSPLSSAVKLITCFCMFMPLTGFCQQPASTKLLMDTNAKAQIFAPGVVSTPYTEWATSFTPDGKTVYFSQGAIYWTIVFSHMENNQWQKPQVASFSGTWRDTDPFVSPDGKRLYFISNRPLDTAPQDKPQSSFHIWYTERMANNTWGAPHHLPSPVNIDGVSNYAPSVSADGTLYFCSRDREGHTGMGSYCSPVNNKQYNKPALLALKGSDETQDPFIAPNGNYLVFVSGNDLFVSYHINKQWSKAEKLNKQVNNGDSNSSPYISPDGKMLYYSSARVKGFYKRDVVHNKLNYDQLLKEMQSLYNAQPNILVIPVHLII